MLYEALAGEPPFTGPTAQAILSRVLMESPRPLTITRAAIPAAVNAVIMKAISRAPADRFQTRGRDGDRAAIGGDRAAPSGDRCSPPADEGTSITRVLSLFALASAVILFVTWTLVRQVGLPGWMFWLGAVLLGGRACRSCSRPRAAKRCPRAIAPDSRDCSPGATPSPGGVLAFAGWGVLASTMVLRSPGKPAAAAGPVRLAVLPFVNQGDSADAYFVDGIADQLRGKLTEIGAVEVIARSSTDLYRGTTKAPAEIGRELDVEYLLSATVRTVRNPDGTGRVQMVPELIKAKSGAVTWQQTFDASTHRPLPGAGRHGGAAGRRAQPGAWRPGTGSIWSSVPPRASRLTTRS